MKRFIIHISRLETKVLLALLIISIFCHSCVQLAHSDPTTIKDTIYGRKDMIRNELVKSNNEVFKSLIESQSLQINSLNKAVFIWQDEYKSCSARLERCKCK
jgi:hypothetical protein